ncbi:MAG: MFS transporter [Actinobacteria bacterium]|nr:MFS transporter [Actinomycetota bacterium]
MIKNFLKILKGSRGRKILYWSLYDFANTSYMVIIMTISFAVYFTEVIVGVENVLRDFYWGLSISISMLIVALLSPILGAISDRSGLRMRFLVISTAICLLFTTLLALLGSGMIALAMTFFILANIGYQASSVFYDSLLPAISGYEDVGRISGFGFAMGYLGAFFAVGFSYPIFLLAEKVSNISLLRYSFLVCSGFFLIFAIPLFINIRENRVINGNLGFVALSKYGFSKVFKTIRSYRSHANIFKFMLSFFLYSNALVIMAFFVAIIARNTYGFKISEIAVLFLFAQIPAVLGSFIFGFIADRIGPKRTIMMTLGIWLVIIVIALIGKTKIELYVVATLAGFASPSTFASSRALMSLLVPKDEQVEFFGLYGLFAKLSSITGPLVFGLVSSITGNQRLAMSVVILFLVAGLAVIMLVKENPRHELSGV